jgi:hypothetical protein
VFDQNSIEPSYQVIKEVIKGIGFRFEVSLDLTQISNVTKTIACFLERNFKCAHKICTKSTVNVTI